MRSNIPLPQARSTKRVQLQFHGFWEYKCTSMCVGLLRNIGVAPGSCFCGALIAFSKSRRSCVFCPKAGREGKIRGRNLGGGVLFLAGFSPPSSSRFWSVTEDSTLVVSPCAGCEQVRGMYECYRGFPPKAWDFIE